MTNVIDFPQAGSASVADTLRDFAAQADSGDFLAAIVVTIDETGPTFKIAIGDSSSNAILGAIGALDVIKARLVRIVEAEHAEE
ncbi:MAG: hypothetical protein JSR89_17140 [Proteobacteria bacterium]|nr:hypothetical protein [Pseudomonadota bacterium]